MGLLDFLLGKKKNKATITDEELVAEGVCPNCWGTQEFDGKFTQLYEDRTKSNINHDKQNQKAFIQQFIETEITGIRLKKDGDRQVCPVCKSGYKHSSDKAT